MNRWAALAGVVAAVALLTLAVPEDDDPVSGPAGSSYVTEPAGAAAYHDLLEAMGRSVTRVRRPLGEVRLAGTDTIIVLEPGSLPRADAAAIARFVAGGGRAVLGGRGGALALDEILDDPPGWRPVAVPSAVPLAPVPETGAVTEVRAAGSGAWVGFGQTVPVLGRDDRVLAVAATAGAGRLVLLADPTPLRNEHLAVADNAAFGVAIAGPAGARVAFVESVHGFAPPTGLAALPLRWRWALAGLAAAVLVWMASRARRLGPPRTAGRRLPPPRAAFVAALAEGLARTRRPAEAIEPVRAEARRLVALRSGLGPDAGRDELAAAAGGLGLDGAEVEAVLERGTEDASIVAAGRALARLGGRPRFGREPEKGTSE